MREDKQMRATILEHLDRQKYAILADTTARKRLLELCETVGDFEDATMAKALVGWGENGRGQIGEWNADYTII